MNRMLSAALVLALTAGSAAAETIRVGMSGGYFPFTFTQGGQLQGFEVDVIRREARGEDPHPLRMSAHEHDLWAVQVSTGAQMLSAARFSQVVVASSGAMARMHTIAPSAFVRLKTGLARGATRDPLKRPKDALQARLVQQLLDEGLLLEQAGDADPQPPAQ